MRGAQATPTRPSFQVKAIPMAKPVTRVDTLWTMLETELAHKLDGNGEDD